MGHTTLHGAHSPGPRELYIKTVRPDKVAVPTVAAVVRYRVAQRDRGLLLRPEHGHFEINTPYQSDAAKMAWKICAVA